MPANLSPDFHRAAERFRAADSVEEKLAALEEMLREIPKHKGTEKLQADIKSRIAKLRRQPARKGAKASHTSLVEKEGAGQVALVGPPNSGKSALVATLTHAEPEVAEYPFTTRAATPGMMPFEDIAFQLVDLPPLSAEYVEPWVYDMVRRADLVWAVLDGRQPLPHWDETRTLLEARKIVLKPARPGTARSEAGTTVRPAMLVLTASDLEGVDDDVPVFRDLVGPDWPVHAVSTRNGRGLEELRRATFDASGVLRVYTKHPGKPADRTQPFTLPIGAHFSASTASNFL